MPRPVVLLVNPNLMRPPIGPIGLEYIAGDLLRRGYEPVLCDLSFSEDWTAALNRALSETAPMFVGVSVRNLDDAYFASQDFILEKTAGIVRHIMNVCGAPVILGGVGFSIAPGEILRFTGAPFGVWGEGETALANLLDCLLAGGEPGKVPGAVFWDVDGVITVNKQEFSDIALMPAPERRFADNPRYFAEGGQAGIETKRGCAHSCIYCVEPWAKGRKTRARMPDSIADEIAALLDQGIDVFHLCDSEFNLPMQHAYAVCDALEKRGLAQRIRWYAYNSPHPFDRELAHAMALAGCAGINFGADHADAAMLKRLGRNYGPEAIQSAAEACRDAGLAVMFDMLLGAPGETRETIQHAIEFMREVDPDRVGLSCGVRVYPYTAMAGVSRYRGSFDKNPSLHGAVYNNDDLLRPIFYVDKRVGGDIHAIVGELADSDKRFLHANPNQVDGNYNYNDNSALANAIRGGARGAYWDILRSL